MNRSARPCAPPSRPDREELFPELAARWRVDRIVPQDYRRRRCRGRIGREPWTEGFGARATDRLGCPIALRRRDFLSRRQAGTRSSGGGFGRWFHRRHLCGPAPPQARCSVLSQRRKPRSGLPLRTLQRKVILHPPDAYSLARSGPRPADLRAGKEPFKFYAKATAGRRRTDAAATLQGSVTNSCRGALPAR